MKYEDFICLKRLKESIVCTIIVKWPIFEFFSVKVLWLGITILFASPLSPLGLFSKLKSGLSDIPGILLGSTGEE